MRDELQNLIEQFGLPETPRTHCIPKESVTQWMKSSDMEVLGALYAFLMDPKCSIRVVPALTLHDYVDFVTNYFGRCFREDPDGDWSHGRYAAAWDFASWFGALWKDPKTDKEELRSLKNWLGSVYREADDTVRHCIVTGALEHLLENREIARFFSDWKKNIYLADAYIEAAEWSGKSNAKGNPPGN